MAAPMYGVLQSIRAILELKWVASVDACDDSWTRTLGQLVEICKCLSELVSPVVCSSSPEGFLPEALLASTSGLMAAKTDGPSSSSSSSSGNAQSLLLCCWHTMKEVSLLLGHLVENFTEVVDQTPPLLTHEQVHLLLLYTNDWWYTIYVIVT